MIDIVSIRAPLRPTALYDAYWRFAAERQRTFYRRLANERPFSDDPVISRHRFTNAYRAADRVSQYLIRHVLYGAAPLDATDAFFRTLLFRTFNKIGTWQLLEARVGPLSWSRYRFDKYDRALSAALGARQRIYSAAYIMPSRSAQFDSQRKHRNHLRIIELMMAESVPQRIADASSAEQAFMILRSYPLIGDFLGYQFLTDLNYGPLLTFSEMDFVVAGPGALGGIAKCFPDAAGRTAADIIRHVALSQDEEFARRGIDFQSLWGRPLQLIDCQNLFCEVDKYSRVAYPEFTPPLGRTRIKQVYRVSPEPLRMWFPPKWRINHRIPKALLAK